MQRLSSRNDDYKLDRNALPRPQHHPQNIQIDQPGGIRQIYGHTFSRTFVTYVERMDSSARYIRSSLNMWPASKAIQEASQIPITITATPFAVLGKFEVMPPKVNLFVFSELFSGVNVEGFDIADNQTYPRPVRCKNCKSLVNPYWRFSSNQATCNMCNTPNFMPSWYSQLFENYFQWAGDQTAFKRGLEEAYDLNESSAALHYPITRSEVLRGTIDFCVYKRILVKAAQDLEQLDAQTRNVLPRPIPVLRHSVRLVYAIDISVQSTALNLHSTVLYYLSSVMKDWKVRALDLTIIPFNTSIFQVTLLNNRVGYNPDEPITLNRVSVINCSLYPFLAAPWSELSVALDGPLNSDLCQKRLTEYLTIISKVVQMEVQEAMTNTSRIPPSTVTTSTPIAAMYTALLVIYNSISIHRKELYYGNVIQLITANRAVNTAALTSLIDGISDSGLSDGNALDDLPSSGASTPKLNQYWQTTARALAKTTELSVKLKANVAEKLKPKTPKSIFGIQPATANHMVRTLIKSCSKGISYSVFYATSSASEPTEGTEIYCDLVRRSGGLFKLIPGFDSSIHYLELYNNLKNVLSDDTVFDVITTLVVSAGFEVTKLYDHTTMIETDASRSMRISRASSDLSICFEIGYKLTEITEPHAYTQLITTYTDINGNTFMRTHNNNWDIGDSVVTLFKSADYEPLLYYFLKIATFTLYNGQCSKERLFNEIGAMFASYRVHAFTEASRLVKKLVLPDKLRGLISYVQSIFKQDCFRKCHRPESSVYISWSTLSSRGFHSALRQLYPFLYPVHRSYHPREHEELDKFGGDGIVDGFAWVPASIPSSSSELSSDGIFLLDGGDEFILYIGNEVHPSVLTSIIPDGFADGKMKLLNSYVQNSRTDNVNMVDKITRVVNQISLETYRQDVHPIYAIQMNSKYDPIFLLRLIEDRIGGELCYADFIISVS